MENRTQDAQFREAEAALERSGRIEDLIRLYENRARDLPVHGDAARMLLKAGELARDRMRNFARAEDLFRRAALAEPKDRAALIGLKNLYEQKQDAPGLAETLERLGAASTGAEAAALYLRAADLHEQKLGRRDRAILCLQSATRADPQAREAWERIRRILMAEFKLLPAFECLQRQRQALGGKSLAEPYTQIAEAARDIPKLHALGIRASEAALELDPTYDRAAAARVAIEKAAEEFRVRVRALRQDSLEERDRRKAAYLSLSVARLYAAYEPKSRAKVQDALDRCFLLWPAMPDALELMVHLAEAEGNLGAAETAIEKMAHAYKEKTAQVDLWVYLGMLRLTRKNDPDAALAAFDRATEIDPSRSEPVSLTAELLIDRDRLQDAVALYERHLSSLKDKQQQISLRLRLARLCHQQLKNPDAARQHLEAALQLEPQSANAAFELCRILAEGEEVEKIVPLLDLALLSPRPLSERVSLCESVALLEEERGNDLGAFEAFSRALVLDPANVSVLESTTEFAHKANAIERLAVALQRAAEVAPQSAAVRLWKNLAQLLQSPLARTDAAQEAWSRVYKLDPNDADAQTALDAFARTLAPPQTTGEREWLEAEARRLETEVRDPAGAAAVLRKLLDLSPDDASVLKRMGAASAAAGKWDVVAEAAQRLADLAKTDEERREWKARLAQVYLDRLDRKDDAAALYLDLFSSGVRTPPVLHALEKLQRAGVREAEIARTLAPLFAESGDFQRQAAALLVQLSTAQEKTEQKKLLVALAEMNETRLMDSRAAFSFWGRALAADPADARCRQEASRIARDLRAQLELARQLSEVASRVTDAELAAALFLEAAELSEEADAGEDAIRALQAALMSRPQDGEIFTWLLRLLRSAKKLPEAEALLERRLAAHSEADPADGARALLLVELSGIRAELGRPADAAQALTDAISAGAPPAQHLPRLAELYEQAGRMNELAKTLGRLVDDAQAAGDADGAARWSLRRAQVLEASLGDRAAAVTNYSDILRQRPTDPDALAALESLLDDAGCAEDAARALVPAYEAVNDHRKLVRALDLIASATKAPDEQVQALRRAAAVHALHLRQPEMAFASLMKAVQVVPLDASVRQAAREAAEDADMLSDFAEAMGDLLEEQEGSGRIAFHRELSELFEKRLNQRDVAISHLRAVLALEKGNVDALKTLQRLHRGREEWAALAEVLENLASALTDKAEKANAWREAAYLHEQKLTDKESAVANWRRIAEQDPQDRDAALSLDRLYTELGRDEDLAFALELRRAQEGHTPQGREVAFRLAQLRQGPLGDPSAALTIYRQILQEDPGHVPSREALELIARSATEFGAPAMELLDPVLANAQDHSRRVAIREARFAHASAEEKGKLADEIRRIAEEDMGQPDLAFMAALKAFAQNLDRERLQPELERLAKLTGSFEELAEIYETAADELMPGDPGLAGLSRRAAQLREQLGETEDAIRLWKWVLEEDPQDRAALDALSRLYQQAQNARNLSEVYQRQAQLAQDPAEKRALLLKTGEAFEEAGDDEKAIDAFKSALVFGLTPEPLEALDRLFGRQKRLAEQAEVLAQLAELAQEIPSRKLYLLRRGQILEKEGQHLAATGAYEQVLRLDEGDVGALSGLERLLTGDEVRPHIAAVLEPLYRSLNDLRKLTEVLEIRLSSSEPGADRLPLLGEIASLRESLGEKSVAFATRLRAFAEFPEDAYVRSELERLAAETGSFEELAGAYQDQLERSPSPGLAVELWRKLASVYLERLGRTTLAADALEEVAKQVPGDLGVLDALARIYRKENAFRELAQVMKRQVNAHPRVEEQVTLLFELGDLAEEHLHDKNAAAACYQAIIDRKPDDLTALKLLGRVLQETERYPELAALLEKEIALAERRSAEEEALDLRVRLGRLRMGRLDDDRGALDLFNEVLRRSPQHAAAIASLEELARSESPLHGAAAEALEPVFASGGDHLRLVQMLEARASSEAAAQEKAALFRRMAKIYGTYLESPEQAFTKAARALQEFPDDVEALQMALSYAGAADANELLAELLEEVGERSTTAEAKVAQFRALAQVKEREDDIAASLDAWRRVLESSPNDPEALETMGRLLASQARAPELLEVLRRQLATAEEPERRAKLLFQMGALQADTLGDAQGALSTFRQLLELRPDDGRALQRMDALCEANERWTELADVLAARIRLMAAAGDDRPLAPELELKLRLAQVRETKLSDRIGSLELYTEILAAQPSHEGALAQVEAMVERDPQDFPASDVLLRAYRAGNQVPKLADLLEARVGQSQDGYERKGFLLELAQLRMELQDEPELAFMVLMRAYAEDPNDAEIRRQLDRAAEASEMWDELAGVLEQELPRVAEARDTAQVCLRLGQLHQQHMDEPERAAEFFERARQLDASVWEAALPTLEKLYTQLERHEPLAEVLGLQAERATGNADKIGYLFRLGQVAQDGLNDPARAAAAFEKILELDPSHLASARVLEALYEKIGDANRLYKILEHLRDRSQGQEKERILTRMAHVSADSIGDVSGSIAIFRDLLAKNPRNDQAFGALEALLEKAKRYDELKQLLHQKLSATIDPREVVRLNDRLGRVTWKLAQNPDEAIPFFKAALERDARHKGALESLREIYESLDRREDLVVVLRRLVPLAEDAQGVKRVRIRLSGVLAAMGRREEALDACRRALEVEPHVPEDLNRVYQIFLNLKAYGDSARALEMRADAELEQEQRDTAVQTLFELADLWKGPAGRPESAGPVLQRVLELDPANRAAYEMVRELYRRHNDWRGYALATDRYLPHLVTDEEKLATLRELALVQEQKLGQKDLAFLALCRAVHLNPAEDELRAEVERLADETGSYDELAAVYEEVADDLPRGPLAERLYLTLARVHDEKLDDPSEAESALRKILEFDPTNQHALDALAQMFARRGRDNDYVVALEQQLETAASIEQRKAILREIARVYDQQMNDPAEAAHALLRALELESDGETLEVLTALYRRQKQWPELVDALMRWRDLCSLPEDRARLQTEIAALYEREIADDEAAVEGYRLALEFDPANREALSSLEQLYTRLDRPADLLAVYERQLEVTQDYRERVKVLFKSAAIWEDQFQNLANADACVEGVLALDPQNLQAIKTLERLRRSQERWEELVGVLEHHLNLLTAPEEQAELCVEMGDVYHQQLRQADRAVASFHQALELNPESRPAMNALGTLYERSGNWPFALDMLNREAQLAGNSPEAVELYHRMGKINEDMLLDPVNAKACYEAALRVDPGHLPSLRAIKGIHAQEQDWDAYEHDLVQEAKETLDAEAKAKALLEVARYFLDKKEDRDQAAGYFEEALKNVPDLLDAAQPLADLYVMREDWTSAERMLDIVAVQMASRAVADQDEALARELCRQLYRLGYVCEKLGRKDKALGAYEKAYQLDATYLPALEGFGNLLVQAQRFEEALKVYQTILIHHRDDLTDLEVVEIYWQLGDIHASLRQFDRAINHFEKALAIDPGHEPTLRSLIQIADEQGDSEKGAEYRHNLAQVLDGEPRFALYVELGKLVREKLSDPFRAIDAYSNAHRLAPSNLEVMDALYVLYRETRQGQRAVEILEKMLAEPALRQSSKFKRVWFALGEICRDELREYDRAVMAFNAALDAEYRFVEAFSALEQLLAGQKQWKLLEENYARMIQRVPKGPETHSARMTLWRSLGDLYLKVLKHNDGALMAYQVVAAGMPDDAEVQATYAQLAGEKPGEEGKAIEAWRRALPNATDAAKVVNALSTLHARRKEYDQAYIAAQLAHGLIGSVGDAEREILAKLSPYAKKREQATNTLTDRLWRTHLFHPKVRGPIADIMAILFEQVGHQFATPHAQYQLNPRKHRIDVNTSQVLQIHQYRYAARLLGMDALELYSPYLVATLERMQRKSNDPAPEPLVGIEICHTHPLCLKVGGKFFPRDANESSQKELLYLLGRTMALIRPELILSVRLPADKLEALFQAAISLSVKRFRFTADPKLMDEMRRVLEKGLTDQARMVLAREVGAYVQTATADDLRNYLEGAELTATRTGMFVAGEVEPVKRMVMGEAGNAFRVPPRSKIRDLLVFGLSEDLHALRAAVGTSVEIAARR